MNPLLRGFHYVAIGIQLAGIGLFAWCWTITAAPAWLVLIGWCVFYGALSLSALRADRKARGVAA